VRSPKFLILVVLVTLFPSALMAEEREFGFVLSGGTIFLVVIIGILLFAGLTFAYLLAAWKRSAPTAPLDQFWKQDIGKVLLDKFYEVIGFLFAVSGTVVGILVALNTCSLSLPTIPVPGFNVRVEKYKAKNSQEAKLVVILVSEKLPTECKIKFVPDFLYLDKDGYPDSSMETLEESPEFVETLQFKKDAASGQTLAEVFDLKRRICTRNVYSQWCNKDTLKKDVKLYLSYKFCWKIGATDKESISKEALISVH
jgi:hypothetical protein